MLLSDSLLGVSSEMMHFAVTKDRQTTEAVKALVVQYRVLEEI